MSEEEVRALIDAAIKAERTRIVNALTNVFVEETYNSDGPNIPDLDEYHRDIIKAITQTEE